MNAKCQFFAERKWIAVLTAPLLVVFQQVAQAPAATQGLSPAKPNIVVILADDLGYGDVKVNNPDSRIPTPNLDSLAQEAMNFTDAHSPSAVCTPTRYGLLTGRYCWRSRMKQGVLGGYSPPLIEQERVTIADKLQANGYHTAVIGKWHLGMAMPRVQDKVPEKDEWEGDGNVDFRGVIQDGPTTCGFDYFFGVSASLDMPPYVWIENNRFVSPPSKQYPGSRFPMFVRRGPQAGDFSFEDALDKLAEKAATYISTRADSGQPFFLYLPLTGPHKPVAPHPRFVGSTPLGPYGDFVANVDAVIGKVLRTIEDQGMRENTLIILTSDNGSFMRQTLEAEAPDHVDDETIQSYRPNRHRANGPLRGGKTDIYEGGHRVPFLVRWPPRVPSGSSCDEAICHTDLFATFAELIGAPLQEDEAEDSYSFLSLAVGGERLVPRPPIVHHSGGAMFAIRDGTWKLVAGNGSGGRLHPRGKAFARPYQLFDLTNDLSERNDVSTQESAVVNQLERRLSDLMENSSR